MALKIVTLDITTERKYTLKADEKEEVKTTFLFKPMSKRQLASYKDSNSKMNLQTNTFYFGNSTSAVDVFRSQVTGWENITITDDSGKELKFKITNGLIDDKLIDGFPLDIIEEVSGHIVTVSSVGEEILEK